MLINVSPAIAEAFFEIFIFVLLCITVVYAFLHWGKPLLISSLAAYKKAQDFLLAKIENAKNTYHTVDAKFCNQTKELSSLQEKLTQWHQACLAQEQEKQESYIRSITVIAARKKRQREELEAAMLRREVMPKAVAQATEKLELQFRTAEGQQLFDELIVNIEKRCSS